MAMTESGKGGKVGKVLLIGFGVAVGFFFVFLGKMVWGMIKPKAPTA